MIMIISHPLGCKSTGDCLKAQELVSHGNQFFDWRWGRPSPVRCVSSHNQGRHWSGGGKGRSERRLTFGAVDSPRRSRSTGRGGWDACWESHAADGLSEAEAATCDGSQSFSIIMSGGCEIVVPFLFELHSVCCAVKCSVYIFCYFLYSSNRWLYIHFARFILGYKVYTWIHEIYCTCWNSILSYPLYWLKHNLILKHWAIGHSGCWPHL